MPPKAGKTIRNDWVDYVSYCADFPEGNRLFVRRISATDVFVEFGRITLRLAEFESLIAKIEEDINHERTGNT